MTEEQRMELLRRLPADELKELITLQMRNTSQILRFLEANDPNAAKQILQELSVDQRLEGLDPKKIAENLPTEVRLEGLAAKERLEGLDPKVVATSLPIEARLEGLDAAHSVLAMPNEVLRALVPEYIATLPVDVQARIRQRLAKLRYPFSVHARLFWPRFLGNPLSLLAG